MKINLTLGFLLCLLLVGSASRAQQYNQQTNFIKANNFWAFGREAALDFSSGTPPTADTSAIAIISEINGSASVCDPLTGDLLFYTDGTFCWNASHEFMPNGGYIMGATTFGGPYTSTTQGVCIVPFIDSPGKYYVFTLYSLVSSDLNTTGSVFYSVVDMELDGGSGAVVPNQKGLVLDADSTMSGSMIAVPGDHCDVWLIVHDYIHPVFKAYHITAEGIDTTPVVSTIGAQIHRQILPDPVMGSYFLGNMCVSPNREMISITSFFPFCYLGATVDSVAGVLLTHFDPATGVISDALQVEQNLNSFHAAFSPDNSKLYLVNYDEVGGGSNLFQYDISTYDSLDIADSKTLIASDTASQVGVFRLYGDTLYLALSKVNTDQSSLVQSQVVSSINQPNLSGTSCDFQLEAINLYPGTKRYLALPSEVVYPVNDTFYATLLDTAMCHQWLNPLTLLPGMVDTAYTYEWSDGSTDNQLLVTESGTYTVFYTDGCRFRSDSFLISGTPLNPVILQTNMTLSTEEEYDSYQWLFDGNIIPGATNSELIAQMIGDYQVIVTNSASCIDTSAVYVIDEVGINDLEEIAAQISLYPNPTTDMVYLSSPIQIDVTITDVQGKVIKEVADAKKISMADLAAGIYLFQLRDKDSRLIRVEKIIRIAKN